MRITDCKVGLKVVIITGADKGDIGTISEVDSYANLVKVLWETGADWGCDLHVSPHRIEPFVEPDVEQKFTIAEINAMLDEIESNCDNSFEEEWYATDSTFTAHGLGKVREYLKDKFEKPDLKKQALAKLTPEEIEALGLKT